MFEFFDERTYASVGENGLENVEMSDYPHHFTSSKAKDEEQEAWNLKQFQKVFRFWRALATSPSDSNLLLRIIV